MPAAINLKNVAQANVAYTGYSDEPNAVEWVESGATSILGTSRLRVVRKMPANRATGILRVSGRLTRPILNGTTGLLDGVATYNFEILRPANISNTNMDEGLARFASALDLSLVTYCVRDGSLPA